MTPEFQKIMFEPFSRADDHRTTKVQGTGLGMAIARNIVNLMNGDIRVESAPNKGTKITVTVYLKLQENEKEQEKNCSICRYWSWTMTRPAAKAPLQPFRRSA